MVSPDSASVSTPPPPLRPMGADEESPWLDNSLFGEDTQTSSIWSFLWTYPSPGRALRPVVRRLSPRESKVAVNWSNFTGKMKYALLLAAVCLLWPLGFLSFNAFQDGTDSTFHPVKGTKIDLAQKAFARNYAKDDWSDPMHPALTMVVESQNNQSLTKLNSTAYLAARNFSLGLTHHLINETCWKVLRETECQEYPKVQVSSYFSLMDEKLGWLAGAMATPDGRTVLLEVEYLLSNHSHARERVGQLMDVVKDYSAQNAQPEYFTVSFTGITFFQTDLVDATRSDLTRMDYVVLPLALFLMGIVLPKAHPGYVWAIPLMTMVTTVCCWSIVMRFVAHIMQITQFTPSIMMSLTMGMGIDYTLFLMSRYLEGPKDEKQTSIRRMIQYGGQVVLLSGLTLMTTFLGLCFLPLQMLKSIGIGAAVAIGCSLIVNLTMVPALLHTKFGEWVVWKGNINAGADEGEDEDDLDPLASFNQIMSPTPLYTVPEKSIWRRLALQLLHPYKSIIIFLVIVQLILPVALYAREMKTSISFNLLMPSTSPSMETYNRLSKRVGQGRLGPYRILFDGRDANITINSELGFDVMHRVLDELIAIDHPDSNGITHIATEATEVQTLTDALMDNLGMSEEAHKKQKLAKDDAMSANALELSLSKQTQYNGIAVLKNMRVPRNLYVSAKYCGHVKPYCPVEALHLLDVVDKLSTSKDKYATFATATLGVNPFSDEGVAWLKSARETLDRLESGGALSGVKVYIQGSAAIASDAVTAVMAAFPTVVIITLLVVFLLMAVFFKSIVTPFRSVVSISMTLVFVYGLNVLVFQRGVLNFTHVRSLMSTGSEVSWLAPVMAFSIIVGLALDYDVFIISRILEFRRDERFGHKSSIVAGLHATGGIITAAGMIMAVAFGGLMLSSSPVLFQWSFMITTAVLLDTFVIRTLVVPIITSWTGSWSWWPLQLPEPRVTLEGFEEEEEEEEEREEPLASAAASLDEPLLSNNAP